MKPLSEFPRIHLGVFPTPLQRLDNISSYLNTNVWIKRDDMTGVALGGNKVRKLEFLLADAKKQGAEIVFTTGGAQSNHAMLTAACALKLGMKPIIILQKHGVLERKGNLLLEYLMGTDVRFLDTTSYDDIYEEMDRIGRASGKPYYKIPVGGSNGLGGLGYVECAREIAEAHIPFQHIVCASGGGGTYAGLVLGAKIFMSETKVTGIGVRPADFEASVNQVIGEMEALLELPQENEELFIRDMTGPGYAVPSKEGNAAIALMARKEGLFLDPVYSGKAFAGLLAMAEEGAFTPEDNVLFVHTGGAGGLFAVDVNLD